MMMAGCAGEAAWDAGAEDDLLPEGLLVWTWPEIIRITYRRKADVLSHAVKIY